MYIYMCVYVVPIYRVYGHYNTMEKTGRTVFHVEVVDPAAAANYLCASRSNQWKGKVLRGANGPNEPGTEIFFLTGFFFQRGYFLPSVGLKNIKGIGIIILPT